ncbi:MAG TPA: hypothetical protein VKA89_08855 [Solirubrobacterales bacterium]|nr:hypothetical protein [Solirubrobacterales bacterium]
MTAADDRAEREAEKAAAEAGQIGGDTAPVVPETADYAGEGEDPAMRPLREAGQGEQEGFELAEADLIEEASHGDERGSPEERAGRPEEPTDAEYGDADGPGEEGPGSQTP